jgi:hypothetical protein
MTQDTPSDDDASPYPADVLINLIVTLLAPIFVTAAGGDIGRARVAALETLTAYQARSHASLIKVANIIAFGLATLGSLSLSMGDDVPIPLVLKLRSNATALDRSTDRNERSLRALQADTAAETRGTGFDEAEVYACVAEAQQRAAESQAQACATAPRAEPAAKPAAAPAQKPAAAWAPAPRAEPAPASRDPQTAAPRHERSYHSQWAAAMAQVAAEEMAAAASLPPDQRKAHTARAAILSSTANTLLCAGPGSPPVPGDFPGFINLRRG